MGDEGIDTWHANHSKGLPKHWMTKKRGQHVSCMELPESLSPPLSPFFIHRTAEDHHHQDPKDDQNHLGGKGGSSMPALASVAVLSFLNECDRDLLAS